MIGKNGAIPEPRGYQYTKKRDFVGVRYLDL